MAIAAVRDIVRTSGVRGLYTGFRLHFGLYYIRILLNRCITNFTTVRDTTGTALYFMEYDMLRHMFGRLPSGEQGKLPSWLPLHPSLLPFICGSVAGITSWALIYPLDA